MPEKVVSPSRAEQRDVSLRPMAIAGAAMIVALFGTVGLAAWLYPASLQDLQHTVRPAEAAGPPLQTDTALDMALFRSTELERLNTAGWLDEAHGVAHIPVEQAMRDVAKAGIADWPTAPYWKRP